MTLVSPLERKRLGSKVGHALIFLLAIWDNRSAFHSATNDYDGLGERFGHRTVGIGEAPYLDPSSRSRTEELEALEAEQS